MRVVLTRRFAELNTMLWIEFRRKPVALSLEVSHFERFVYRYGCLYIRTSSQEDWPEWEIA